jgi:hypothetical protein
MKETLMGAMNNCLLPFFKNCVLENYGLKLLKELDKGQSDFPVWLHSIDYFTCKSLV